ncbi:MAG: phosphatidate cytidylyltransferase, partial [Solirubrobacteraceae bacterium]
MKAPRRAAGNVGLVGVRRRMSGSAAGAERGRSDLRARVLAAIPAIAVAVFLVIEGGPILVAGLFVLGAICLHELFTMYERTKPVRLAGFVGLAGMLAAAHWGGRGELLLAAVCCLPVVFLLGLTQRTPSAPGMMVSLFGLWWVGFGFAHAVLLRDLPHGMGVVLDVLVGTFVGDTGAYLGGRLFGRRLLAPSISPNKTIEGLVVGMICAIVSVWLAGRYESWMPATHSLVLGLGVAVAGPVGDLFESFVKRQAGTKDTGSVFGAHGGALDRLDAVLFT